MLSEDPAALEAGHGDTDSLSKARRFLPTGSQGHWDIGALETLAEFTLDLRWALRTICLILSK